MAFESINVEALKNSLTSCKESINHSISESLVTSIMNDNVWLCDSRNNLRLALNKLNSIYSDLEAEINKSLSATAEIGHYKELEAKANYLENEYNNLNGRLYYQESYKDWYYEYDENGNQVANYNWATRTVKDTAVESEMISIRNQINGLIDEMKTTKNRVDNLI